QANFCETQSSRDAALKAASSIDQLLAQLTSRDADPERPGVGDQAVDELPCPHINAKPGAHGVLVRIRSCVQSRIHVRTNANRSSRSARAAAAVAAPAWTVHSGSPALIAMPARGRSADQLGHSNRSGVTTSCSA